MHTCMCMDTAHACGRYYRDKKQRAAGGGDEGADAAAAAPARKVVDADQLLKEAEDQAHVDEVRGHAWSMRGRDSMAWAHGGRLLMARAYLGTLLSVSQQRICPRNLVVWG